MSSDPSIKIANLEKQIIELKKQIFEIKSANSTIPSTQKIQTNLKEPTSQGSFSVEQEVKNLQSIVKNQTKMLVAFSDFMQSFRESHQASFSKITEDQKHLMKSFQAIVSSVTETLRTEFLMVLRDFRDKYPELEKIKIENELKPKKPPFPTLESGQIFTSDQASFLERKFDEIVVQIERQVQNSFQSVVELLSHLMEKVDKLRFVFEQNMLQVEDL